MDGQRRKIRTRVRSVRPDILAKEFPDDNHRLAIAYPSRSVVSFVLDTYRSVSKSHSGSQFICAISEGPRRKHTDRAFVYSMVCARSRFPHDRRTWVLYLQVLVDIFPDATEHTKDAERILRKVLTRESLQDHLVLVVLSLRSSACRSIILGFPL